ncbi:MAG: hypothetical protein K9I25_03060 [Crocinitomicaceae bacterium]|nr:hypothetical protein [Crocinitomicaceae bacterium]
MKTEQVFFKTRIPVSEELKSRCLNPTESGVKNRYDWLIAASLLLLVSINISACLFALGQEKPASTLYLINFESYE